MHTFWAAYRFTGDARYLKPIDYRVANSGPNGLSLLNENFLDVMGKRSDWSAKLIDAANKDDESAPDFPHHVAWEQTGNLDYLASIYRSETREKLQNFYMNTEGHWWSDRVESPTVNLQRARLGGVALKRNQTYPGHTVSWRFADPEAATQVAIAIPAPRQDRFTVIAYNTSSKPQRASMTGWNVAPGQWRITQGADRDGDGKLDSNAKTQEVAFEKSASIDIDFPAGRTTVLQLERIAESSPVELRPDLGIGHGDVRVTADAIEVTVHSLGHANAPAGFVVLEDAREKELARAAFPALAAPRDLRPITTQVRLPLANAANLKATQLRVITDNNVAEITDLNNKLPLPTSTTAPTTKNSP
ncbi:conserved hypothetical protein [Xanthomonas citri pv. citri]|nr:conserved hypothetical protein [Xanthomonas citri pv. citri]CEE41122.1 conserved hypothetical protein [Xanthomonas citri pv. citri]CEE45069.1 conserved hypothetical protein [Xanthomonas citri pv. citri]CEE67681.1 conserved hypothetical protein [Xanthomonas citri pv. citri]CEH58634.1 conserved hypothetical protein [Xanthomonas citri pv. citri]